MPTPVVTARLEDPSGPTPLLCALCPSSPDGFRPRAVYRAWIIITRREDGQNRAVRYALCDGCLEAAVEHGDLVPGAKAEIL